METVETRVKRDSGMDFLSFLKQCKKQSLNPTSVAEILGCSVSNCRRIMRKYNFSLYQKFNKCLRIQ